MPVRIRKFHEAKLADREGKKLKVRLAGTGPPLRGFLHVDDLARAARCLMEQAHSGMFNIGYGKDLTCRELAGRQPSSRTRCWTRGGRSRPPSISAMASGARRLYWALCRWRPGPSDSENHDNRDETMAWYLCDGREFTTREGSVWDDPSLNIVESQNCALVTLSSLSHIRAGHYENSGMHGAEPASIESWLC